MEPFHRPRHPAEAPEWYPSGFVEAPSRADVQTPTIYQPIAQRTQDFSRVMPRANEPTPPLSEQDAAFPRLTAHVPPYNGYIPVQQPSYAFVASTQFNQKLNEPSLPPSSGLRSMNIPPVAGYQIQTSNNDMSAVAAAHAAQLQATQTGTAVPNSLQRPDYALHDCIADVRKVCGDVQTRIAALCQSMATVPGVPSSVNDMLNNDLRGVNQQVSTLAFHVRSMERLSEDRTRHIYEERAALITGHETEKLTLRGKLQAYQDRYHKTETELRESQASWVTVEKRRKAEIEKKTEKVMNQKRRIKEQQDQIDNLKRKLDGRATLDLDSSPESSPTPKFDDDFDLARATGRKRATSLTSQEEFLLDNLKKIDIGKTAAGPSRALDFSPIQPQPPAPPPAPYTGYGQFDPAMGVPPHGPIRPAPATVLPYGNYPGIPAYGPSPAFGADGFPIAPVSQPQPGWNHGPAPAQPGWTQSGLTHPNLVPPPQASQAPWTQVNAQGLASAPAHKQTQSRHSSRTSEPLTARPLSRASETIQQVPRSSSRASHAFQNQPTNAIVIRRPEEPLSEEVEKKKWHELFFRLFNACLGFTQNHCAELTSGFEEAVLKQHGKTWDFLLKVSACFKDTQATPKHAIHLLNSQEHRLFVVSRLMVQYCESEILHWKFWLGWGEEQDTELSLVGPITEYVGYPLEQRQEARLKLRKIVERVVIDPNFPQFRNFKITVHAQHLKDIITPFVDRGSYSEASVAAHSIANLAMEVSHKMMTSRLTFQFTWSECGAKFIPEVHQVLNSHLVDLSQKHLRVSFIASPGISYRDDTAGDFITKHVTLAQAMLMH